MIENYTEFESVFENARPPGPLPQIDQVLSACCNVRTLERWLRVDREPVPNNWKCLLFSGLPIQSLVREVQRARVSIEEGMHPNRRGYDIREARDAWEWLLVHGDEAVLRNLLGAAYDDPKALRQCARYLCRNPVARGLLWSLHKNLSRQDIVWVLIGSYPSHQFEPGLSAAQIATGRDDPPEEDPFPVLVRIDRPHLTRIFTYEVARSKVRTEHLEELLCAGLHAGVDPRLFDMAIEKTALTEEFYYTDTETAAEGWRRLFLVSPEQARALLLRLLNQRPSLFDRYPFRRFLGELTDADLLSRVQGEGKEVGKGLLGEILRRGRGHAGSWRVNDATRNAALEMLLEETEYQPSLIDAIEALTTPPDSHFYEILLRFPAEAWWETLSRRSKDWPRSERYQAWMTIAQASKKETDVWRAWIEASLGWSEGLTAPGESGEEPSETPARPCDPA